MNQKQAEHDEGECAVVPANLAVTEAAGRLLVSETLRSSAESSGSKQAEPKQDEEHMSLFWRVFGGTILSISALVVMTLYNNMSSGITDLRAELNREQQARAELVKKEEFNTRSTNIYDRLRSHDGLKADLEGLRERVAASAAAVDGVKRDTTGLVDGFKKEMGTAVEGLKKEVSATTDLVKKEEACLEVVKDRLTAVETLKRDVAGIDVVKEKLLSATTDIKALRDDISKVQMDVERSRSSELERKSSQEILYKQIEDSLKELQKGLQDCREKLARLEGAQPATPARTVPAGTKP
jgi:chromosome segregation ATPase